MPASADKKRRHQRTGVQPQGTCTPAEHLDDRFRRSRPSPNVPGNVAWSNQPRSRPNQSSFPNWISGMSKCRPVTRHSHRQRYGGGQFRL